MKKKKNERLFLIYFRRYVLAFAIAAVVVSMVLTILLFTSIRKKEVQIRQDAVNRMVVDFENQLDMFDEIRNRILFSHIYQPAILFSTKYNEIPAAEALENYVEFSPVANYLFLHYEKDDLCFTSDSTKNSILQILKNQYKMTNETQRVYLADEIFGIQSPQVYNSNSYEKTGDNMLLFAYPLKFTVTGQGKQNAVLGIIVSEKELAKHMEKNSGYCFSEFVVYLDQKCIIGQSNQNLLNAKEGEGILGYQTFSDAKDYLLLSQSQSRMLMIYAVNDWNSFSDIIWKNTGFIVLAILILSVLFFACAFFMAKQSAQPFIQLVDTYGVEQKEGFNELRNIELTLSNFEQYKKTAVKNAKVQLLTMIIQGRCDAAIINRWEKFGISLPHSYNNIYIVRIPEMSVEKQEDLLQEIENFSSEIMSLYAIADVKKNRIIVIGSFSYLYSQNEMYENLVSLVSKSEENNVYMGINCDNAEKLSVSYQSALENLHSENEIFTKFSSAYEQLNKLLEKISKCVEERKDDGVSFYLDEIRKILEKKENYMPLYRYTCSNLISILQRGYSNSHIELDYQITMNLILELDYNQFCSEYLALLQSVFQKKEPQAASVVEQILSYIEKNISECDMCLDSLSIHFELNTDYISRLIKGRIGVSFKEYVTRIRIDKAKTMLIRYPEMSVNEISEAVGYRTTSNFIKKFRDELGMTPLRYRSEYCTEKTGVCE